MTLKTFSLKTFSTHAILCISIIILLIPLLGLSEKSVILKLIITIVTIGFYWLFVYAQVRYMSEKDCNKNDYNPKKAVIAGGIVQIPGVILYLLSLTLSQPVGGIIQALLRVYLAPYMSIFVEYESIMPHITLLFMAVFPLGTYLSYIDGKRMYKKMLKLIEETEGTRSIKSRTDYEG